MLTVRENAKHGEMAGGTPQTLESYIASNFHFLWTGDKL
jgi:hypothetical protein